MSEELATINVANDLSGNSPTGYCSLKAEDRSAQAKVFNAANNPDGRVSDLINKTISVTDIMVEMAELVDDDGVQSTVPRVVLITEDGKAYVAMSYGIYSAVRKAVQVFGQPTWDPALNITIKQVPTKNGSMLTFDVK